MPRIVDPSTVPVGNGLAPRQTVDTHSLVQPTGAVEPLAAHVADPNQAHMASTIGVVDAGGYYSSDEVEGILQEVGGGISGTGMNGLLVGGTWTDAGLVITLDTPTVVLIKGVAANYSGATVTLADGVTNVVYIDGATGVLTAGLAPPVLANEPILIAAIHTDGFGNVDFSADARFFVPNVQRKPSFTVRSAGATADQSAEGCFVTLEAALAWLTWYTALNSVETRKLVIRGNHSIAASTQIPTDNIIFEGEGDASFTTGAVLGPLFDLNGSNNITFRNITFICNHAGSTAIADVTGPSNGLTVENCIFQTGTQIWDTAIEINRNVAANQNYKIADSTFTVTTRAIIIDRPEHCLISNCVLLSVGGTAGIILSPTGVFVGPPVEGHNTIEKCIVTGFESGILMTGYSNQIVDCTIRDSKTGITIPGGNGNIISGTDITLDSTDSAIGGLYGIILMGTLNTIDNCIIINPRAAWTATAFPPCGVWITPTYTNTRITNCTINGFYDTDSDSGFGVFLENGCNQTIIQGTTISTSYYGIANIGGIVDGILIENCRLEAVQTGISITGARPRILGTTISLDATRGLEGIEIVGANCTVADCFITNPRVVWPGAASTNGIDLGVSSTNAIITGNIISGFLNTFPAPDTGAGINALAYGLTASGNQISGCANGIVIGRGTYNMVVTGNAIRGSGTGIYGIEILGLDAPNNRTYDITVNSNTIRNCITAGIHLEAYARNVLIDGNTIDMVLADAYNPTATGIYGGTAVGSYLQYITVSNNNVLRCKNGITFQGVVLSKHYNISIVGNTVHHCGYAQDLSAGIADTFEGRGSKGIGLEFVGDALVESNTLSRIGVGINDAGTEGYPDLGAPTQDVQSKGIYLRNCVSPKVSGNTLDDMDGLQVSMAPPTLFLGNGVYYEIESSGAAGTFTSLTADISNNTVRWAAGVGNGGYYGIYTEVWMGGTAQDHVLNQLNVNGNNIYGPKRSGICIATGDRGTIYAGTVTGNNVRNCCSIAAVGTFQQGGIVFQTLAAVNVNTEANIFDMTVVGNRIFDAGAVGSGNGIVVYTNRWGTLKGFVIDGNGLYDIALDGICACCAAGTLDGGIYRLQISDNEVQGGGTGITYSTMGALGSAALSDANICDNRIIAANSTTGIEILTTTGFMENIKVVGNEIDGAGTGSYGIRCRQTLAMAPPINTNLVIDGNVISDMNADGIVIDTTGIIHVLSCSGNNLHTIDADGISILNAGLASGIVSHNSVFAFNTDAGANVGIFISQAAVSGLAVVGNTIQSTFASGTGMSIIASVGNVSGLSVSANDILMAGAAGGVTGLNCAVAGTTTLSSFVGNNVQGYNAAPASVAIAATFTGVVSLSTCIGNTSDGAGGADTWDQQFRVLGGFPVAANNAT